MRLGAVPLVTAVALLVLPGLAAAEDTITTTEAPTTTVAPAEAPAAETTLAVGDEVQYRAALLALSADPAGPHTIDLTADITVDDGIDPIYTGTQPLTIDGHGFTLDAVGSSRLLVMDSPNNSTLDLAALTLTGGATTGDGGAVQVVSASPTRITDSRLVGSSAQGSGGAVASALFLTVERTTFEANAAAAGDGGAVVASGGFGDVVVIESLFRDNRALAGRGGAIAVTSAPAGSGGPTLRRSSFVANQARQGGAISSTTGFAAANSTLVGNTATLAGGAVFIVGPSDFFAIYSTFAGNRAPDGASVAKEVRGGLSTALASAFAEPVGGANCGAVTRINGQASHSDDGSCGFGASGPALLGPLQDNGGPTPTRAPLAGSPLIDAIRADAFTGIAGLGEDCAPRDLVDDVDQRGEPRPVEGDGEQAFDETVVPDSLPLPPGCDIGAVEVAFDGVPVAEEPTGPVAASPSFTG